MLGRWLDVSWAASAQGALGLLLLLAQLADRPAHLDHPHRADQGHDQRTCDRGEQHRHAERQAELPGEVLELRGDVVLDDEDEEEDDEDEDEDASDDEAFDSDDLENWDEEADAKYGDADLSDDDDVKEGDAALERMIARARVKPDESERTTNKLGIDTGVAARFYDESRNDDGSKRGRVVQSNVTGMPKVEYPPIEPEYDSDSSTEDVPNRIGQVPLSWYDDLPHIGYDINGRRVLRPAQGDELDKFLDSVEGEGDGWFSAHDKTSGQDVKLTDEELDIIQRLERAQIPVEAYDPYEPATDWFTQHQQTTPLTARPEPKRRFVPSKWEHKKIMKIVRAIRQGRIVAHAPGRERPAFYNLWSDADEARADHPMHMPAPKLPLPITPRSSVAAVSGAKGAVGGAFMREGHPPARRARRRRRAMCSGRRWVHGCRPAR